MDNRKGSLTTYIKDGLWKCNKSPTNAHFWIQFAAKNGYGEFYCKWCYKTRWFPITQDTCLEAIGKSVHKVPYTPNFVAIGGVNVKRRKNLHKHDKNI